MLTRCLISALLATALCPSLEAQQFVLVPDGTSCADLTPDGRVVVGDGLGGVFWWDWKTDPSPVSIGGSYAVAVSDDGLTILGGAEFPPGSGDIFPAIWTESTGWQSLGTLGTCGTNGRSYDLSGDGMVAVGSTWVGCNKQGFRWTAATGMQPLDTLGNGDNRALVTNDDGSALGGSAQGNAGPTPSRWASDLTGSLWDMGVLGKVAGMNNDGIVVLGQWDGQAFFAAGPFFNPVGSLNSGWGACATEISEDNDVIAGHDTLLLDQQAWLRDVNTAGGDLVALDDILLAAGFTGAPPIRTVNGMSDDGEVLVGNSGDLTSPSGYILDLELVHTSWVDLGNGLASGSVDATLTGSGDMVSFDKIEFQLTGAFGGTASSYFMVMGVSALNAPFKGGVLVPHPDLILGPIAFGFPFDGSSEWWLPAGMPTGFTVYFQVWIPDTAAAHGFAASNGLSATTP